MTSKLVLRADSRTLLSTGIQGTNLDIEATPGGGFVAVWGSTAGPDNQSHAVVQMVNAAGELVDMNADEAYTSYFIPTGGDPFSSAGYNAQVSVFDDGSFVVGYYDGQLGAGPNNPTYATFNLEGDPILSPTFYNVLAGGADVVALAGDDGNYFVSFANYTNEQSFIRTLEGDLDGGPAKEAAFVEDFDQRLDLATSLARNGDGAVLVYTDPTADKAVDGKYGVTGVLLDKDGFVTKTFQVNKVEAGDQVLQDRNAVEQLADGGFVVTYTSVGADGVPRVLFSLFDEDAKAIARDVPVSSNPTGQNSPAVAALPDGGFVVAWDQSNERFGIKLQLFDRKGEAVGDPVTYDAGDVYDSNPSLTVLDDGTVVLGIANGVAQQTLFVEFDIRKSLTGDDDPNKLTGGKLEDELNGLGGDDTLIGRGGGDTLNGGDGRDSAAYDEAVVADLMNSALNKGDADGDVYNSIENLRGSHRDDRLFGDDDANELFGGKGADLMVGRGGNDTLNSNEGGPDTMVGGLGDDLYLVYQAGATIEENALEGFDTVRTLVDLKLGKNAEIEVVFADTPREGDRNIDLTGSSTANRLVGNSYVNRLDGGGGADTLEGGRGSDVYVIDDAGDQVVEEGGKGTGADRAEISVSWTLGAGSFLETLQVAKNAGAISITGNETNQEIYGNEAANTLIGGGGADSLYGAGGKDSLDGGDGDDYLFAGDASRDTLAGGLGDDDYEVLEAGHTFVEVVGGGDDRVISYASLSLKAGVEIETLEARGNQPIDLKGNEFFQTLIGNSGANRLDGAGGDDTMQGGAGSDVYLVDSQGDKVVEKASDSGLDQVIASVDYRLAEGVDVEALSAKSGKTKIALMGNSDANDIDGNDGDNRIDGGGGNDTLDGGDGFDEFVFGGAFGRDRIEGFDFGKDVITLDFKKVDTFDEVMAFARKSGKDVVFEFDADHRITAEDVSIKSFGVNDFSFF